MFQGAMDSFARGLKNAAKLIEDGTLDSLVRVSVFFFLLVEMMVNERFQSSRSRQEEPDKFVSYYEVRK